jgi:hypothetical protein
MLMCMKITKRNYLNSRTAGRAGEMLRKPAHPRGLRIIDLLNSVCSC